MPSLRDVQGERLNAPYRLSVQFACAECRHTLQLSKSTQQISCDRCGKAYECDTQYLEYTFDAILFKRYRRRYLLNKVLNNNASIGYKALVDSSLSLSSRADVGRFRDYLARQARQGRLLDIGCGPLPLPGYLDFADKSLFELYGLDPMSDRSFRGFRITGCSEFMPFADGQFDTVVYATSLDHVCSPTQSASETFRITAATGRLVIWMGDRSLSILERVRRRLVAPLRSLVKGYRTDRYVVYPNYTVLYIPHGAVDPYHSYHESPSEVVRLMTRAGFRLVNRTHNGPDEVFLCFEKPALSVSE